MSLEFLDTYEKYVHEDKKEQSSETELFKLDEVETKKETEQAPVPQASHLSDEDIERIAKKLAEMQAAANQQTEGDGGGDE